MGILIIFKFNYHLLYLLQYFHDAILMLMLKLSHFKNGTLEINLFLFLSIINIFYINEMY